MNPLFRIDFSISDSLKIVRKSVLIYETIIFFDHCYNTYDTSIVILDAVTANVDPENEKNLMNAVDALTKEKMIIMIAHRLKTVRHVEQIVVVDKERIVQQETYD